MRGRYGGRHAGARRAGPSFVHRAAQPTPPAAAPRGHPPALGYLAGLDGLRACALLAVMAFHHGAPAARGGYLGVSTFFTLSGFLITSLAIDEWHRTGRLSWRRFWERRARRLLPAASGDVVRRAGAPGVGRDRVGRALPGRRAQRPRLRGQLAPSRRRRRLRRHLQRPVPGGPLLVPGDRGAVLRHLPAGVRRGGGGGRPAARPRRRARGRRGGAGLVRGGMGVRGPGGKRRDHLLRHPHPGGRAAGRRRPRLPARRATARAVPGPGRRPLARDGPSRRAHVAPRAVLAGAAGAGGGWPSSGRTCRSETTGCSTAARCSTPG